MKQVRCAIYTRKSSEEGLEQDFNSLDAQREACAAYVLSQASEGWGALPDFYDDGGLSGGTLERPALQRLLIDIEAGKVDIVVVYKVDRLTRSLLDFSKLVETFDKAGVSFVSVTQSFNTTTSMGRLTLNMLLSFAQFEREVTAERIRDKISASKARGMWMGGLPPLGYEPDGRSLKIVPGDAQLVQRIYERYLALGAVRLVAEELANQQVTSPPRQLGTGRAIGGRPFSRGQLYAILRSPIYVGEIPHKGTVHPGLHEPIIDRDAWDKVQAMLADHVQGERVKARKPKVSPLSGKVFDGKGGRLVVSHACKGMRRYRYYIGEAPGADRPVRIPAAELEGAVAHCLASALDDPLGLCARAWLDVAPASIGQLLDKGAQLADMSRRRDASVISQLVATVRVLDEQIEVVCDTGSLAEALQAKQTIGSPATFTLVSQVSLRRSGRAVRLVHPSGAGIEPGPHTSTAKLLIKARRWWQVLRAGEVDITRLAEREGVTPSYLTRVVRLAFLSPAVVEAVLAGQARVNVDGTSLTASQAIPADWTAQAVQLLPA